MIRLPLVTYYGVFLDLRGKSCRVIGGGRIALAKIEGLLAAGAAVRVVSREAVDGILGLTSRGEIDLELRAWRPGDLSGAFLAIAATDEPETNRAVAAEAESLGIPVNVVDVPGLSSFIAPAVLRRGDLQVAVSTGGAAPALAGKLRDRIGEVIGPELEATVEILRRVRESLRASDVSPAERRAVLRRLAHLDLAAHVREGDFAGIEKLLAEVLGAGARLDSNERGSP